MQVDQRISSTHSGFNGVSGAWRQELTNCSRYFTKGPPTHFGIRSSSSCGSAKLKRSLFKLKPYIFVTPRPMVGLVASFQSITKATDHAGTRSLKSTLCLHFQRELTFSNTRDLDHDTPLSLLFLCITFNKYELLFRHTLSTFHLLLSPRPVSMLTSTNQVLPSESHI